MQNEKPKVISPNHLLELVNAYVWLDAEHQERAVKALIAILNDQIAETKGVYKAI